MRYIGIQYQDNMLENTALLLWALNDAVVNADFKHNGIFGKDNLGKVFELTINDTCFRFANRIEDLVDCDKKIKLVWNDIYPDTHLNYDKQICFTNDIIRNQFTDDQIKKYLDEGNILLSISDSNVSWHRNFIFNPLLPLISLYYDLGLFYINYHQAPKNFKQLLGIYHRSVHIGGSPHGRRNFIFDKIKEQLKEDFVSYSRPTSDYINLLESYKYFGKWFTNHNVAYTDYATSVCNIVYETFDSINTNVSDNRMLLTEKTVKSIIFCEENIFFIWYGPEKFYKELSSYGFWFLNSEFYNEFNQVSTDDQHGWKQNTVMVQSVFDAVNYLQNLKTTLGSNEAVYNTLMEKYGHNLKENVRLFKQLEQNCPVTGRLVNAILN